MLFTVLIANFNNSAFLATAINSVRRQTYPDWEVVVVDDCSTDGFSEYIAPFVTDSRIRWWQNKRNMGCGYTKRRCAGFANGDLLGFLDADDALHPDAIGLMVEAHKVSDTSSLIWSTHFVCDSQLQVTRIAEYPKDVPENTPYLLLNDGRVHHFASFKRKAYLTTPGISPHLRKAVDQDLYYKLEEVGTLRFIDIPLYYYRIHKNSISTTGSERSATLWHYRAIEEACLRRIKGLEKNKVQGCNWGKMYQTKYVKTKILHAFRRKAWLAFTWYALQYPFAGGLKHFIHYIAKIRTSGLTMVKRTYHYDHEIIP